MNAADAEQCLAGIEPGLRGYSLPESARPAASKSGGLALTVL